MPSRPDHGQTLSAAPRPSTARAALGRRLNSSGPGPCGRAPRTSNGRQLPKSLNMAYELPSGR